MKFTTPIEGRKGAYYLRNRESLLNATQRVLAEKGSDTKIEDIAREAEMAVSTIYKHFPNRDELVEASMMEAMRIWETDTFESVSPSADSLEQLVAPMKAFLNMKHTHPLFAKIVSSNRDLASRMAPRTAGNLIKHVEKLVKSGVLQIDSPELRTRNLIACLFAALDDQLTNPKSKDADNIKALAIALAMIGISQEKAADLLRN